MAKLLQRLSDPSRSGVYRVARPDEVLDAANGSRLHVARIALSGARDKPALLATVSRTLRFPAWFGANWDALEDCLTDLSWTDASGYVLLLEGWSSLPAAELAQFREVLQSAASHWSARNRPFFAVFVAGPPDLPPLMREKAPSS
jgi:hypothetical protein